MNHGSLIKNYFETKKKEILKHKEKLNAIYFENLSSVNQLNKEFQNWRFNILTDKKEQVLKALFSEGLFASSHYAPHTNRHAHAAELHKNVINLFNDIYFSEAQALETCQIINKIIIA